MSSKDDEIRNLLAPAVSALGLELLGLEWVGGRANSLLRLYIDAAERAVTVDDCEAVSREVEGLLDVHDPIPGHYTLEVSSPGIDRPLFSAEQFGRHKGEDVKLLTKLPRDGRRRYSGRIANVEGERITLATDAGEIAFDFDEIEKANIVPDLVALGIAPQPKPSGRKAGKARRATGDGAADDAGEKNS